MIRSIKFRLNGQDKVLTVELERSLLWLIRNDFEMTGTKYGCGMGHCGACTVLVNKKPVRTCMVTADFIDGKDIVTIEGLEKNGELNPVQKAFVEHESLQCGFCTPGMIMNATGLLYENPDPSREEIIDVMEENLCRCGSYGRIIDAIQDASKSVKGGVKL